jgi:glycine/D-amino acid oxidase-like deaminating enzyme
MAVPQEPHRSFWIQELQNTRAISGPLRGKAKADIAIIGGGYVGLWTAYRIKQLAPSCRVVVLERDICGGGASGRNGGFALSWWPKLSSLVQLCGRQDAVKIAHDSENAITEIRDVLEGSGIPIDFRQAGWLWTATSSAQMNAWEGVVNLCEQFGVGPFERLSSDEVARRSGSTAHRAGVLDKSAATLHPAKLAFGLKSLCERVGVQIFENTAVRGFTRTRPVEITTTEGSVSAETLIIANNAWAASIRELARSIVAITSDMIVTEPIPDHLQRIGWRGGECITDSQTMVDYYHATSEGRIAFGKGGWGIAYGGRLGADFDRNTKRAETVAADFRRYYPSLSNVKITHDWCGPIDRTPNSLPLLGRFPKSPNILYGVGWSGNGVGPSVLGGKILASLALNLQNEWASYPLVHRSVGKFPPEPIRYIGAHVVRTAVAAKERAEIDDLRPSFIASQLAKLAPKGLEDKELPRD